MKHSYAPALATLLTCALSTAVFAVEHGTLTVTQRNLTNNGPGQPTNAPNPAVTVSVNLGNSDHFNLRGFSKGDFELAFTDTPANDRVLGVMLSSIAENARDNGVLPNLAGPAGVQYGTSQSEPSTAGYYIPAQATLNGPLGVNAELNINVAGAWFPHSEGWLGAHYVSATTMYTSPAIRFGNEFVVNTGTGTSRVDLRNLRSHGVPATSQNGILLATGGENNQGNIALSQANADGTFTVSLKYSGNTLPTTYLDGRVAFVYLPVAAVGNGHMKAMGKIRSDGGAVLGGGDYTVTKLGTGQWLLKIGGLTAEDGTLIIAPEGGMPAAGASPVPNNTNNFLSYQWSPEQEGYIVNSRDNATTALQDGATADEPMFSFVFLTPGENPPSPTLAITSPATGSLTTVGQGVTLKAAAATPAGVTVSRVDFYVGGQLVGTANSAPYEVPWTVDQPGHRLVEAFAYTADNKVAGANRVAIWAQAAIPAPAVPGYSMAILNGGDREFDVTAAEAGYVPTPTTPWIVSPATPAPLAFDAAGDVRGAPLVRINGAPVPFNSGILLSANYAGDNYADIATRGAIDNNVIAYPSNGNYALKVEDNQNNQGGAANPLVRAESGRFALGYFPFANGWVGATLASDGSVVGGNSSLPSGVIVSRLGTSSYIIEGLPSDGNLLAVSHGETSDNVASVARRGNQWIIYSIDNNGTEEADSVSFLYVPTTAPKVFSGLVLENGTLNPLNENLAAIGATVAATANGYEILIGDGNAINPSNTVLFLSADYDNGPGEDNICAYYASGNKFIVFSHDLPGINGNLQNGGFRFLAAPLAPTSGTGAEVFVSSQAAIVDEGATGANGMIFRFARLGGDRTQPLTVNYTVGGSATAGTDFQGLTGTVTFPADVTTVEVQVPALADELFDLDETVTVNLATGSGYTPAGGAASAAIRNVLFQPGVATVGFQQGVNGYLGYFGKRVGGDPAAPVHQLETGVQNYALDGPDGVNSFDVNGILRFDNIFGSDPGQIPVGAEILKAELVITTAGVGDSQSPGPWVVDRLVFPVTSTTTYLQMTEGSNDGARGISSRSPVAGFGDIAASEVVSADVTKYLRIWAAAANPNAANLGFSIYEADTTDGWNYCTAGNDDPTKRPKLLISYALPGQVTKSYSYDVDKSVRLVGLQPSFDGSTLGMSYIDQAVGATQEGIFHFPVEFGAGVGAIPEDEEIVRAELQIYSSSEFFTDGDGNAQSTGPVAVHRMLVDFTPTSNFGFSGPVVGTDIAIAEKARVAGMGDGAATTFDVTSMAVAWSKGDPNFGINLKPETQDGWQLFWPGTTGQYADRKPKLVIYTAKESGASGFDQWASANGIPGAAHDSDADRDRIPALVEYALGLNPAAFNQLPGLQLTGGNAVLSFTKGSTDPRLSYEIKSSTNLTLWNAEPSAVNTASNITLTIPAGSGKKYFRLVVTYN